jgi:hypothetical protein
MYGVVRPVAKAALSWQSGGPVPTDATCTTRSAYAAYTTDTSRLTDTSDAAWATNATNATNTTNTTNTTDTTRLAHTSDAADTAGPTDTTDSTDATRPTDTANASHTADTAYPSGPAHATDAAYSPDVIPIEAVVVVDINIATAPPASPAPTAAPPRSHHDSGAEGKRGACHVVAGRIRDRWIWIRRFTVYSRGLICRHVYNFRISRLYHNHALVFNYSRFYRLLLRRVQSALVLRLRAHSLNGIHQFALLGQECIAKIGSPLKVIPQ